MRTCCLLGLLFCVTAYPVIAQDYTDALRYSTPGLGVGARALGMGMAYTAVANDFSATYWNPAGLGQIRLNELSLGLSHISSGNSSTYYGSSQSLTNSSTDLNDVGLVYPFPVSRGSLVFTLGFERGANYAGGLSFDAINPNSSIIQSWARNGDIYDTSQTPYNLAYQLYLADLDTARHTFYSPLERGLQQLGTVLDGGGQNNVTLGGASEVAKNVYIGLTLNFITGSYTYNRDYNEIDSKGVYSGTPLNGSLIFSQLALRESFEDDLSGFNAKIGFLYRFAPKSRIAITIKTPSWMTIRETYSQSGTSYFTNGFTTSYTPYDNVKTEYDLTTPFVFGLGISHTIQNLLLAADVEYTDWTQMEFSNADQSLLDYNTTIKQLFQATANVRVGGEYAFQEAGVRVRAGFDYEPSPYQGDPSSFARKYVTGGLGFIIEDAIAIDLGYAYGWWDNFNLNYNSDPTSRVDEKITTNNLIGTVSYRF